MDVEFLSWLLEIAGNCMFRIPGILSMSAIVDKIPKSTYIAIAIVVGIAVVEALVELVWKDDPMRELKKALLEAAAVGAILMLMPIFGGFTSLLDGIVGAMISLGFAIGFTIMFLFLKMLYDIYHRGGSE